METLGVDASPTPKKQETALESGKVDEEIETDTMQVRVPTCEQEVDTNRHVEKEDETRIAGNEVEVRKESEDEEEEEEVEEEEETLVVLELCDFKNHPIFDDYSSATLEGIDTATPMLRIGEYALHGQLEETVGTSYFYDTDTTKVPDKTYQFVGQTIKKIKFTIAPPEDC